MTVISRLFGYFEEGFLNLLITLMTLLVFGEVIARFFFNTGFLWIQELTLTLCGWFVLFGMSYGVKVGAHIGVDAFVSKLSGKPQKAVAIFACLCCIVYCGMFLKGAWDYLSQMYQIGIPMEDIDFPAWFIHQLDPDFAWETLRIDVEDGAVPIWLSQSILIIGFSMLTWRFIELFIAILRNKAVGFQLADEAKDSMHLIDEAALSTSSEQQQNDKDAK
ncbi:MULTISPECIES: TRAP transporter small permease [unclassified Shewanella]|jgi:C4-dicarboxylate transporter DctQ subunit|uniref:TRAP transporter small permease n=1 Tax=Shewanella TaxID=22 RepID=UPI00137B9615|nr:MULTISPECIES: TRAP transporter small permease [unclassified Shewanella]MBB1363675.1 TRAP transporter small permease [Shewanella sp. SR44-4]QHS14238.1 TRAP transporter small permease [Shewanella sp. Arc9-LZ]